MNLQGYLVCQKSLLVGKATHCYFTPTKNVQSFCDMTKTVLALLCISV